MSAPFDFLDPLARLQDKIDELKQMSEQTGVDVQREISGLDEKLTSETRKLFATLTPWQRVQLSRHPLRPQTSDYIGFLCQDWVPLAGDRLYGDDEAIISGLATINGIRCMVIGQQKGKDVHERRRCNFGMPHPEGYRKAMLKMRLAERFALPVVCLVNTPGAFPGVEAEERGQSIAIAENIRDMAALRTPIIIVVIGEGGSGGALGIGVGDRMLMLENSYFSVISPEGCAAILWKDGTKRDLAAARLGLTAVILKSHRVVDEIIAEPPGGAHRRPKDMATTLGTALARNLKELAKLSMDQLMDQRYKKLRLIGEVVEGAKAAG
ncbi:MAG: acetyl-CoA carboxylase carboxyltransferase subunit alpha [Planctomycetota bacterium]